MLKYCLLTMGAAVVVFVVSAVLHSALSEIRGQEELFFMVSILIAPTAFAIGLSGTLAILVRKLLARR